jgi:peptidyl-prolyl cis-trans isomerase A (cyclophilin A)
MDWNRQRLARLLLALIVSGAGILQCDRSSYPAVQISTELGEMIVELYPDKAPLTANNFISLVEQGVYSSTSFYRVVRMDNQPQRKVKIEVIQGGLFDDFLINKHPPIAHESTEQTGIKHRDGVISMARMEPGSASTEIFICVGDQPSLDYQGKRNPDGQGFAAFGKVTAGMDVVRAIQALPDSGQYLIDRVIIKEINMLQ